MARKRDIKPGFFLNEDLAELEPLARLLFAGLWCWADKAGRLEDRPRRLKAEILPYDNCDGEKLISDLTAAGFLIRYEANGTKCLQIVNWKKHQSPHPKEAESELPPPDGTENQVMATEMSVHDDDLAPECNGFFGDLTGDSVAYSLPDSEQQRESNGNSVASNVLASDEQRTCNPMPSYTSRKERDSRRARAREDDSEDDTGDVAEEVTEDTAEDAFGAFWSAFPKKRSKASAEQAWGDLKPSADLARQIVAALERARASPEWQRENGRYVPKPAKWLAERGWEDEYTPETKTPDSPKRARASPVFGVHYANERQYSADKLDALVDDLSEGG